MRRPGRPLLVALALCGLAAWQAPARGEAPSGAERLCGGGSDKVLKKDNWTTVEKPEALSKITAHAVGGDSGELMLVTDGHTVMRSTDRGCSWKPVYTVLTPSVEDTPADGLLPEVARMLFPTGSSRAILVLEGVGRSAGARVLVSDAGGAEGSFQEAQGVPPAGQFRDVVAAPDNPDVIYLVTTVNDQAGQVDPAGATGPLYVSKDGGASFAAASAAGGQLEKLAVEPDSAGRTLWAATSSGRIQSSKDSGATWTTHDIPAAEEEPGVQQGGVPQLPVKWLDVAVFRISTRRHLVAAVGAPNRQADVTRAVVSPDRGGSWQEIPVDGLGPAGGLFFGRSEVQLYSSVPTDNTAYRGPGLLAFDSEEDRWAGVDAFGLGSLKDPRAVREPLAEQPNYNAIWMRRDKPDPDAPDLLARFEPPPSDNKPPLGGRPDCRGYDKGAKPSAKVVFDPSRLNVQLKPGEATTIPVKADVPGDPTPADLFFLMDHSDSMDPAIEGLRCSIDRLVRDMPERGLDAHFGLGAYNGIDGYTYRRLVNVLPPAEGGPAISEELRKLFSTAGVQEPMRSALFQTATGAGFDRCTNCRKVEPGQQADWRPPEKKIPRYVLLITDEPYEENTPKEPAFEEVVAALKAKGIRVIGLRVQPKGTEQLTSVDHSPARQLMLQQQLSNFARGTQTLAPKGGVDCDGGGTPDIPTGEPIVCTINEQGIKSEFGDTLVSILTALPGEDLRPVRLVPRATGGLTTDVKGGEATVNIRRASRVEGDAVLSCTQEQAGRRFEVAFDVVTGDRVLGSLEGTAQCGEVPAIVPPVVPGKTKPPAEEKSPAPKPAAKKAPAPAPPPEQPAPVAPGPLPAPVQQAAAAAAPPPAPPAPAPISPAAAQAPAVAPSNATAPQAGAAAQEDRQVASKLATVSTDVGGSDEGVSAQHAMVASRPRAFRAGPVPVEAMWTLGIGTVGLFGFVAFYGDSRRRRKGDLTPALADERRG